MVAMRSGIVGRELFVERANAARLRATEAQQAAEAARRRVAELHQHERAGSSGVAEAEERRLLAEERLARVEAQLAEARQRSIDAHERAARLDDAMGKTADARRHYDAANDERQLIEDEALKGATRRKGPTAA